MMNRLAGEAASEVRGRLAAVSMISSAAVSIVGPRPDARSKAVWT